MALHPSGSKNEVELIKVETDLFTFIIKGKPYHERYIGLRHYQAMDQHEQMEGYVTGQASLIQVFDIHAEKLVEVDSIFRIRPIFFENGQYQVVVQPKLDVDLHFYHEHPILRQAVSRIDTHLGYLLMGTISFQNEVGFTTLEIREGSQTLLKLTFEIFPVKLDYKKDYYQLLEEVNEEIYNLAFHFIRKTFQKARIAYEKKPSQAEFFRLLQKHIEKLLQTLDRIEKQPHHHLQKSYEHVRADRIKRQDSKTTRYLASRPHLFIENSHGFSIDEKHWLPVKGLTVVKRQIIDNQENQTIKFLIERLLRKIRELIRTLEAVSSGYRQGNQQAYREGFAFVTRLERLLASRLQNAFWREISSLKTFEIPLALQMAPGYRDIFHLYLLLIKGLSLHGHMYQLSLKDVALLYEYWTFLKMGQLLAKKYELVSQDIVQVNQHGLMVHLEQGRQAKRVFRHPQTNELITLIYQRKESKLPTAAQEPDSTLLVEKKGSTFTYNYIFDAKYRVDFAINPVTGELGNPGPEESDINTMHRYRDAIVSELEGTYERTSFGAYVLFPWSNEEMYQEHKFYKSIEKVNIGGLPFLPNTTKLVEHLVDQIIEKSPEELQREGILPIGAKEEWLSQFDEVVLVGKVGNFAEFQHAIRKKEFCINKTVLREGWQEAKYVALYLTKEVGEVNGIAFFGKVDSVDVSGAEDIVFHIKMWQKLEKYVKPVGYGIATYVTTTLA